MSWFTDLFIKRSYSLPQTCLGCAARQAHIEDLQNLLKSEREGYAALLAIVVPTMPKQAQDQTVENEMKPLRQNLSMAQRRRQAEEKERAAHPNATQEYWTRVKEEYETAGKLPTVEVDHG